MIKETPIYTKYHNLKYTKSLKNGQKQVIIDVFKTIKDRNKYHQELRKNKKHSNFKFWSELIQTDIEVEQIQESTQISIFDILTKDSNEQKEEK